MKIFVLGMPLKYSNECLKYKNTHLYSIFFLRHTPGILKYLGKRNETIFQARHNRVRMAHLKKTI